MSCELTVQDLTPRNVFICSDTFKVTSIDWQHTIITPLLLAAGYPKLFENPDPEPPTGLTPPEYYSSDYDTMSPSEQAQVDELIRRQSFSYVYRVFNGGVNKVHPAALQDPLILQCQATSWHCAGLSCAGAISGLISSVAGMPISNVPLDSRKRKLATRLRMIPCGIIWMHWSATGTRSLVGSQRMDGYLLRYEAAVRTESLKAEFSDGGSPDELEKFERGCPSQDHEEFFWWRYLSTFGLGLVCSSYNEPFLSAVISFIISPAFLPTTTLQSFLDNQSKQQRE